jgi:hypothetical protein
MEHPRTFAGQMGESTNGNLIYNHNNQFPMTPNLRHSSSMYAGNMANSMNGDPEL